MTERVHLSTYVSPELAERVRALAKKERRSVAFLLKEAVLLLLATTVEEKDAA